MQEVLATATRSIDERIQAKTLHDVTRFVGVDPVFIDERIRELEKEWDVSRTFEAKAGLLSLAGIALGVAVDRRFLLVPVVVAGFLLQHSMTGWSPSLPLLRRLGIRTSAEIHQEIIALKIMRGDYLERTEYPERALAGARTWA
ncbi:MAG TPA: hypothetical protein VMF52_00170 [Steroidobacteraceae bacterium]|nr:hypothetical protein [Steroidobacteraceae bacterium]